MELKVWCDAIQRVVCGVTPTTTCQDIVFALAHATAQTGRFILIEKWRNSERVLAPSDWPLASLSKWGEYAGDVTFIMKRSGDVTNHTKPKTLDLSHETRKPEPSIVSSKSMPLIDSRNYATMPSTSRGPSQTKSPSRMNHHNAEASGVIRDQQARRSTHQINPASACEPLYGTIGAKANRPRQPPPYQEAIARSSLVNNKLNPEPIYESRSPASYLPHQKASSHQHPSSKEDKRLKRNSDSLIQHQRAMAQGNAKSLSSLHQDTMNLIDIQKQTLINQDKDIANIENEISMVERKVSENNMVAKRFKDEMDYLNHLWQQQEHLIQTLESENHDGQLNKLMQDEHRCQAELHEAKHKLSHCEQEINNCKLQICNLVQKINELSSLQPSPQRDMDEKTLIDGLLQAIGEKNTTLEEQNEGLNSLTESIEHFDKLLQDKNDLIDKLTIEIKEANVEGLALQAGSLYVEDRGETSMANESTISRNGSTRKISVAPHELGQTVPTKKNPDGIWV